MFYGLNLSEAVSWGHYAQDLCRFRIRRQLPSGQAKVDVYHQVLQQSGDHLHCWLLEQSQQRLLGPYHRFLLKAEMPLVRLG